MYDWRKMNLSQRKEAMALRRAQEYPWHGPPHFEGGEGCYHISAACYEHRLVIGQSAERMAEFEAALLQACGAKGTSGASFCSLLSSGSLDSTARLKAELQTFVVPASAGPFPSIPCPISWCVLPNHYHLLVATSSLRETVAALGRLHGRFSYAWNVEDNARGRKVWHRCADRAIKSERHFWATMNYVHHNPVKHGFTKQWQDWPFSSAQAFLDAVGREEAARIWTVHPTLDYGKGWDD